jgi:hypothetical protein
MRVSMRFARFLKKTTVFAILGCGAFFVAMTSPSSAADKPDAPPAPKASTFAPADDLARQVDRYIGSLQEIAASESNYKDDKDKLARESNTLVIIALTLGLHDQDNKYKAAAGSLMKAAQAVAAAKDYAAVKKAVAALPDAAKAKSDAPLRWEKVAALPELMNQVPAIHTRLKVCVKETNLKKYAKEASGHAAVIAAIAQGTLSDPSAAKNPDQIKQWRQFSAVMRDAAAAVGKAVRAADARATTVSMKKLAQSCENCHAVFRPDLLESAKEDAKKK